MSHATDPVQSSTTGRTRRAQIGDKVHDPAAGRTGIVTNIDRADVHLLRPEYGGGLIGSGEWEATDPTALTVLQTAADRAREELP